MKALLIYSSREGQTKTIVSSIADELRKKEIQVDLYNVDDVPQVNFADYNGVLIGAAIRYGHFHKEFRTFVERHYQALNQIPSAFVSVSLIARKVEKQTAETNSYTRKYLAATQWHPTLCGVFAGALRYPRYTWLDRVMIQLIMKMTKGETDSSKDVEYTDWDKVKQFAGEFERLISK
ncbi:menaquinone-dependent protoporphyrinogen IX dehydrogenase [Budviciaceae bacterium BWR-B9]|uniref:Protoporphyrinogen IX dehydrogenase [quinone] n=1 Tax=Limnobaculum allomyrinae TaxID=2791986 RepID=A0ABS1IUK9_9GAMM|nr:MULTISPECIES: menaquinone-dependent protoporphyrinogen IX dehydrogenase [Limnobaculum]MBK5145458.1 menaquinone-dependent protoporphyrinogen IX dehydrogenase [Limnobaculum allomyrinae]MBV7693577.1 menaquinone-dependent protoporphyrinogen IX dehydrogenase [Limnobaculum sp. M2-1]